MSINSSFSWKTGLSFLLAGLVFAGIYFFLPAGFSGEVRIIFAIIGLYVVLSILEPIPLSMNAVLVLAGLVLTGHADWSETAGGFASNAFFLTLGGFMMAQGVNQTLLGRRLAYLLIVLFGKSPAGILAAVLIAVQVLSFFVPASSVKVFLLLPPLLIIVEKLNTVPRSANIKKALFLALAFGAVISSVGILPGAVVNVIAADLIEINLGVTVTYFQWLVHILPVSLCLLAATWFLLLRFFPPEIKELPGGVEGIRKELDRLGKITSAEKKCTAILTLTVLLWMTQSWHGYPTALPALLCALLMGLPGLGFTHWNNLLKIDWGTLIFIGVVLSIGKIVITSGAAVEIAGVLLQWDWLTYLFTAPFLAVAAVVALGRILHLIVGSAAVLTVLLVPAVIQISLQVGTDPVLLGMAGGASSLLGFVFMVQNMSNVVAYSYDYFSSWDLARAGIILTLISIVVFGVVAVSWWPFLSLG